MPSTLIMPCAGKSTRFNLNRPKWMLTHPNGNLMLMQSIYGIDKSNISRIIITVVKEHIENSKIHLEKIEKDIFLKMGIEPEFLILDDFTKSQSDTVYQTILQKNVIGPIFIKDCDNYFNTKIYDKNLVCISFLEKDINVINKSYVTLNKYGFLSGIVEKQIVGDKFCVGGYSFENAKMFCQTFEKLQLLKSINKNEIYISHVIQKMLLDNETFEIEQVTNYSDWGTMEDWKKYTLQFKTIFIDLDGTLVFNSSEYFEPIWGRSLELTNNVNLINKLYDEGKTKIIITTSRKETSDTLQQLKEINIKYHQIIFGLLHAQRILINDYSATNPYPSAIAINLERDQDKLINYLNI